MTEFNLHIDYIVYFRGCYSLYNDYLGKKDKKGKKGKKDKDPTSNRSIDDLWEELVKMEIVIPAKDIHLKDFIGDYSFLAYDKSKTNPTSMEPGTFYEFSEAIQILG